MNTSVLILPSRLVATFLVAALFCTPLSPLIAFAEEAATSTTDRTSIDERLEERAADPVVDPPVVEESLPEDPLVVDDPSASSTSTTDSGEVAPEESDTDNTDFENVTGGAPPPDEGDGRPVIDASATSTEALASDPFFATASSTDGTGHKIGGTIFTGDAVASTTVKNILNITKSNVDGPGVTNGSIITGDVDNEATLTTTDSTQAETGENIALGGEGLASIKTGRAVGTAQVLNVVNTNLFNSEGLVLFINPLEGDGFDLRDNDLSHFFDEGAGASA